MDGVWILALSSLLLLLHCPASLPVTVSTREPKVEVHEHSDAVLSCEFRTEKETNPRIEWKKIGADVTFVYFEGKFIGSFAGRAKMEGATVTLHSVTLKDSGVYRCEVSAAQDHIILGEANVTLNVLVPPHTPSCEVPSSVLVGAQVELLCKDQLSVPPASYCWFKDNKALSATASSYSLDTSRGTLKFQSVSQADSGLYRCESSNSVGAPKSCVAQPLKVIQYQLSVTTLMAGAVGLFLLVFMGCLGVCLCHRQGCCRKEKKARSPSYYVPATPPTLNHKNYKHPQSFMI